MRTLILILCLTLLTSVACDDNTQQMLKERQQRKKCIESLKEFHKLLLTYEEFGESTKNDTVKTGSEVLREMLFDEWDPDNMKGTPEKPTMDREKTEKE